MPTDTHLREGMAQLDLERHALALEQFTIAADAATDHDERRAASAFAAQVSIALGRPYEAIAWAERLREDHGVADEADLLEATALIGLGDGAQASQLLGAIREVPSSPYTTYPDGLLPQLRCQAHALAGDDDAALLEALAALLGDWALPEIWRCLAGLAARHDVEVTEAVARIPDDGVLHVLGWLLDAAPAGADVVVEAMWQRFPGDRQVLAMVTSLGNQLPLPRAMEWSARLRAAGLGEQCAVLGIAADGRRPADDRIRAAAVAGAAFGDPRAATLVEVAAPALADDQVAGMLQEVLEIGVDDVVDAFVVGTATTPERARLLAELLAERGAQPQADALVRHADRLAATPTG